MLKRRTFKYCYGVHIVSYALPRLGHLTSPLSYHSYLLPPAELCLIPKVLSVSVSLSYLNGRLSTLDPERRARKSSSEASKFCEAVLDSIPEGLFMRHLILLRFGMVKA